MVEQIIGATVAQALTDIDMNAGAIAYLVKPYTRIIQTGQDQFKDFVFPVAKNVITDTADCEIVDGYLHNVAPHIGISHLIHISQEGDFSAAVSELVPQRRGLDVEFEFSVNVWMSDHQGTENLMKAMIIKTLHQQVWRQTHIDWYEGDTADPANFIYINKLKCQFLRDVSGNPFADFDFSKDQALLNQKYVSFGLVFKMSGLVMYQCAPDYPALTADECQNPTTNMRVTSSGTYTPTITNEAGIDTITISQAQYMRVGNTVTVSGSFALQSTEMSGDFSFDISLPVASNIGANEDVAGVLKGKDQNTNGGVVYGNISGDTAKMDGNGRQEFSVTFYYTFTYQVI